MVEILSFIPQPKKTITANSLAVMLGTAAFVKAQTDKDFEILSDTKPMVLSALCSAVYEAVTFRVSNNVTLESVTSADNTPMNLIKYEGELIGYYETYEDNAAINLLKAQAGEK